MEQNQTEQNQTELAGTQITGITPLECLHDLRAWLVYQREVHTVHVEPVDERGRTYDHPSGFAAVRIPEWDVRQKIENIEKALAIGI